MTLVVIAGFAESLMWFGRDPKAAFYLATPRAWELALGALVAICAGRLARLPVFIATVASGVSFWLYPRDFGWVRSFSYSTRRSCVGQWARQTLSNQDWIP